MDVEIVHVSYDTIDECVNREACGICLKCNECGRWNEPEDVQRLREWKGNERVEAKHTK